MLPPSNRTTVDDAAAHPSGACLTSIDPSGKADGHVMVCAAASAGIAPASRNNDFIIRCTRRRTRQYRAPRPLAASALLMAWPTNIVAATHFSY
jgi:hypothetical protein